MAARQFGFVVARALAIFCWLHALTAGTMLVSLYLMAEMVPGGPPVPLYIGLFVIQLLLGTFLWTTAPKFAGPTADVEAKVQGGEWVVRLVFSAVGTLLIAWSLGDLIQTIAAYVTADRAVSAAFLKQYAPQFSGEIVRFLIGIWLVSTNRFTRYRIADTEQG